MKRTICSMVVTLATIAGAFAHDVISISTKDNVTIEHIEHCYIIRKHEGKYAYVIRYKHADDKYHDVYVTEIASGVYYGYESDGNYRIVADKTTDIAVE